MVVGDPEFLAEFCWADDRGVLGLAKPEDLEREGWIRVRRHPRWHSSWIMRRDPA